MSYHSTEYSIIPSVTNMALLPYVFPRRRQLEGQEIIMPVREHDKETHHLTDSKRIKHTAN